MCIGNSGIGVGIDGVCVEGLIGVCCVGLRIIVVGSMWGWVMYVLYVGMVVVWARGNVDFGLSS